LLDWQEAFRVLDAEVLYVPSSSSISSGGVSRLLLAIGAAEVKITVKEAGKGRGQHEALCPYCES